MQLNFSRNNGYLPGFLGMVSNLHIFSFLGFKLLTFPGIDWFGSMNLQKYQHFHFSVVNIL